jgi:hypothetical protein
MDVMPRYIIKLDNLYCEWSTIVDAPVSQLLPLDIFTDWYVYRYGEEGRKELPDRLERVEKQGTSAYFKQTVDDLIRGNRAGENEKHLTKRQIIEEYSK